MTTHDRPAQPATAQFQEPTSATADAPPDRVEPETNQAQQVPPADNVAAEPSTEESLFARDKLSGLRSRWDHVQAGFVDNPQECVQQADGLVSDVVDELTNAFSQARSGLEAQWARGEQASTEDLRIALKRYREFFDRLLAV